MKFYTEVLGMTLLRRIDFPDAKFSLFFLASLTGAELQENIAKFVGRCRRRRRRCATLRLRAHARLAVHVYQNQPPVVLPSQVARRGAAVRPIPAQLDHQGAPDRSNHRFADFASTLPPSERGLSDPPVG